MRLLTVVASNVTDLLPLLACAIPFGVTYPPLFAATRALLTRMAGSEDLAATAFAFEAIVQEAFFITGPLLVALLVAVASPQAALAFVAVVTSVGTLAFAATQRVASASGEAGPDQLLGALASPGVRTLLVVSAAFGLAFGTLEVTMPAFADERGSNAVGGVLLAALARGQHAGRRLVRVAHVGRAPLHADDLLLGGVRRRARAARLCRLDSRDAGADGAGRVLRRAVGGDHRGARRAPRSGRAP